MNDHGRCQIVRPPPRPPLDFPPGCPVGVNANTFPAKLWKLVNDECYTSINWTNNGTSVGIDAPKFKYEVLKRDDLAIFKTKNFSSFVRQLNLYGFRKLTTVHPSSRHCEFSENHAHTHSHHQARNGDNIQHFQHSFFLQAHPDFLPRVRRASASQKRKDSYGSPSDTFGILRDTTNIRHPFHQQSRAPYPVGLGLGAGGLLHTQGEIFGLSLIASTSRGSLIATPPSGQFDFAKLCNQQGQLKKFVVIGQQDKIRNGLPFSDASAPVFLGDPNILSANAPILEAYNMSPLTNPDSSLGYSLKKVPFNTGISEAESAVSYLMNDTFESSPAVSPLSSPQREPDSSDEFSLQDIDYHASYRHSSVDVSNGEVSPRSTSHSLSSSHLSAPSSSTFLSATNSSASTFGSSSGTSSSRSLSFQSSLSAPSFSNTASSSDPSFSTSLGSSGSDNIFCSSASSSDPVSDIITSAFMSATQESMPLLPLSLPSFHDANIMPHHNQLSQVSPQMMASPIEHMAAPFPCLSPVGFAVGPMPQMVSSTPIALGKCLPLPNCQGPVGKLFPG